MKIVNLQDHTKYNIPVLLTSPVYGNPYTDDDSAFHSDSTALDSAFHSDSSAFDSGFHSDSSAFRQCSYTNNQCSEGEYCRDSVCAALESTEMRVCVGDDPEIAECYSGLYCNTSSGLCEPRLFLGDDCSTQQSSADGENVCLVGESGGSHCHAERGVCEEQIQVNNPCSSALNSTMPFQCHGSPLTHFCGNDQCLFHEYCHIDANVYGNILQREKTDLGAHNCLFAVSETPQAIADGLLPADYVNPLENTAMAEYPIIGCLWDDYNEARLQCLLWEHCVGTVNTYAPGTGKLWMAITDANKYVANFKKSYFIDNYTEKFMGLTCHNGFMDTVGSEIFGSVV